MSLCFAQRMSRGKGGQRLGKGSPRLSVQQGSKQRETSQVEQELSTRTVSQKGIPEGALQLALLLGAGGQICLEKGSKGPALSVKRDKRMILST